MVEKFVLLPDKGNAVHPAHRFGDQMIEVNLRSGERVRFARGTLVWVWGTLRGLPGNPLGSVPLYQLQNARTQPTSQEEIPKYFR